VDDKCGHLVERWVMMPLWGPSKRAGKG
jgi:hypothetical protein